MRYKSYIPDALERLRLGKNLKDNPDEFVYEVPGTDVHKEVELVLFYPTDFYFRPTPRFRMGSEGNGVRVVCSVLTDLGN